MRVSATEDEVGQLEQRQSNPGEKNGHGKNKSRVEEESRIRIGTRYNTRRATWGWKDEREEGSDGARRDVH
jgi:hypothetical protein